MAISARELLLVVRAQNQASSALRRVARDTRGLTTSSRDLRLRGRQLQLNNQNLRTSRDLARQEQARIISGSRGIALDKARAQARLRDIQDGLRLSSIEQQRSRLAEANLRNLNTISRTQRQLTTGRFPRGVTRQEAERTLASAQLAQSRLLREQGRLAERAGYARGQINAQELAVRQLAAREAELSARSQYLTTRMANQGEAIALNNARIREINRTISAVRWERLAAGGRVIQHLGRVGQYAGLVVGGAFAYAADSAAKFQSGVSLAATQVGNTARQVVADSQQMQRSIVGLMTSGRTTAGTESLQKTLYDIFSSLTLRGSQRNQVAQGTQLLEQFSRAAIAGQTDIVDVAHAGISVLNDFGGGVDSMRSKLNRMFAAVRFGRMTFSEFVGTLGMTAPAAKAANQSFDVLSGAMAFLTRKIPNVNMAAAAFARLMEVFQRREFQAGMQAFGARVTDAHNRLLPLPDILDKIAKRFPRLTRGELNPGQFLKLVTAAGGSPTGLSGTIQARRALTFFIRGLREYHQLNNRVINDQNEFSKSFTAMANTSGVKWELFKTQIHGFAIAIGEEAIPAITQLARPLMDAVKWFNSLDDSTKRQIGRIGVFGAAILLAGSAVSFMLGLVVRLYALLGRGLGFWNSTLIVVGLVAAAVGVLSGGWRSLDDAMSSVLGLSFHNWQTTLLLITGITVAVVKLTSALREARLAFVAAYSAQAAGSTRGGVAAGLGGIAALPRNFRQLRGAELLKRAEERNAARMALSAGASDAQRVGFAQRMLPLSERLGANAVAGAAAFGVSLTTLGLIGVAVGGVAGGLYLWKRHLDAAHRAQERLNIQERQFIQYLGQARREARLFGRTGIRLRDLRSNINDLKQTQLRIRQIRQQLRTAPQAERPGLRLDLSQAIIDRANAVDRVRQSTQSYTKALGAFNRTIQTTVGYQGKVAEQQKHIRDLLLARDLIKESDGFQGAAANAEKYGTSVRNAVLELKGLSGRNILKVPDIVDERISAIRGNIQSTITSQIEGIRQLGASTRRVLRDLGEAELIPHIPRRRMTQIVSDVTQLQLRLRRGLTLREMRLLIRAEINPRDRRDLPRWVRNFLRQQRELRIRVKLENVRQARNQIRRDIFHHDRDEGVGAVNVNVRVQAQHALTAAHRAQNSIKALFAPAAIRPNMQPFRGIGRDIDVGIAHGVSNNNNIINIAVRSVVDDAFRAAQRAAESHSPSRRAEREIGKPFVQGIAMGISRNRLIALTAASQLTLDLFQGDTLSNLKQGQAASFNQIYKDLQGQKKTLTLFNKDLLKLAGEGVPTEMLKQLAATGVAGAPFIRQLAQASRPDLDRYVALWKQANAQIVQSNDQSATSIKNAVPQAVIDARQKIQSAVQGLTQMYQQLLQQNQQDMGELFSSSRLQDVMEWGGIPRATDLLRDLTTRTRSFARWHKHLNELTKRGAPKTLIEALRALGPQADKEIQGLIRMTPRQWRAYLNAWRVQQRVIQRQTMRDLHTQLAQYRRFGRNIALAIIAGLRSENVSLEREMRRMLYRMFPDLFRKGHQSVTGAATHGRHPQGHRAEEHTHYHVHPKDSPTKTELKHAHFKNRNRRGRPH